MNQTKGPLQSVTIVSALVALLATLAKISGIQIDDGQVAAIQGAILDIVQVASILVAIWGRWRATHAITVAPAPAGSPPKAPGA